MSYNNGYHHDEESQLAKALARLGQSVAEFIYRIMNVEDDTEDEDDTGDEDE